MGEIKLPEPVAYMGTFQIAGCKPGKLAHHTHTNLETLKVSGPQGQSVQPLFTADQLRVAVMAEREACAARVEQTKEWKGKGWTSHLCHETAQAIAAAIRAGQRNRSQE